MSQALRLFAAAAFATRSVVLSRSKVGVRTGISVLCRATSTATFVLDGGGAGCRIVAVVLTASVKNK